MIKKLLKSFIPYLILLIGIFSLVIFLDNYARKISEAPTIVVLSTDSNYDDETNILYLADDNTTSEKDSKIKSDTSFTLAIMFYRE
jgi:spermidine/putrescine-binding protein